MNASVVLLLAHFTGTLQVQARAVDPPFSLGGNVQRRLDLRRYRPPILMHSWVQCNCQNRPVLYQRLAVSSPVGEPGMVAGRRRELYPEWGAVIAGWRGQRPRPPRPALCWQGPHGYPSEDSVLPVEHLPGGAGTARRPRAIGPA